MDPNLKHKHTTDSKAAVSEERVPPSAKAPSAKIPLGLSSQIRRTVRIRHFISQLEKGTSRWGRCYWMLAPAGSRLRVVHVVPSSCHAAKSEHRSTCGVQVLISSSLSLSSLELSDTKVYEPHVRALLGNTSHRGPGREWCTQCRPVVTP